MVHRFFSCLLPILLAGLVCAGCAELAPRRGEPTQPSPTVVQTPGPQESDNARALAEPMAPLQIPGPATPDAVKRTGGSGSPGTWFPQHGPTPPAPERLIPVPQNQPVSSRTSTASPLHELYRQASARYATVDGYIVRLRRREQVGSKNGKEEIILVKFRKEPWSVYLRWIGSEAKDRQVVYVKNQYGNKIHTLTSAADSFIGSLGAGKHIPMAPDHPMVLSRSRYPITETGVGAMIDRYGRILESCLRGANRFGTLKYLGPVKRPEFDMPVEAVMQQIPPGVEPGLPDGGQRFWFFNTATTHFPVLTVAQDNRGVEVEYYCYDNFFFADRLRDDEFDPDRLFKR